MHKSLCNELELDIFLFNYSHYADIAQIQHMLPLHNIMY